MRIFLERVLQVVLVSTLLTLMRAEGISQPKAPTLSPIDFPPSDFTLVISNGTTLIAADSHNYGVDISTDNGQTWSPSNIGLPFRYVNGIPNLPRVTSLYKLASTLYVGTEYLGVWKSTDGAHTWEAASGETLADKSISRLVAQKDNLFALAHITYAYLNTSNDRIYRSSDAGHTWIDVSGGILDGKSVSLLIGKDDEMFALAQIILSDGSGSGLRVYRSSDSGQTWEEKSNGIPIESETLTNIVFQGTTLIAQAKDKLYVSDDNGGTWKVRTLPANNGYSTSFAVTTSVIYAASASGLAWRSGDKGQSWEAMKVPQGLTLAYSIIADENYVILFGNLPTSGGLGPSSPFPFLYFSSDAGTTFSGNLSPYNPGSPNYLNTVVFRDNSFFVYLANYGQTFYRSNQLTPIAAPVSAASYQPGSLASESVVSAFGTNLASTTTSTGSGELPTTLANTSITITDRAGNIKSVPLFYISPTQINFQLPGGLANGVATFSINLKSQSVATGVLYVTSTAPGLFSADQTGTGLAAANVQRVSPDGSSTYENIVRFDQSSQQYAGRPINVTSGQDQPYLNLYGTGIRGRSDLSNVSATIGGISVPVTYAGPHGSFIGVDQVNILLPSSLAGKGLVDIVVTVDQRQTNAVEILIQ